MIQRLKAAEVPLAYIGLFLAVLTVVWKTIGVGLIPGFNDVWGEAPGAQYPRRPTEKTAMWDFFYLALYGGLGTVAQNAGLEFSKGRKQNTASLTTAQIQQARLLGLFHCVIGVHHIVWSLTRKWGQLELSHLNLPMGGYVFAGMHASWTTWHGFQLLTTSDKSTMDNVVRHKVMVDMSSFCSVICLLGFLPANWFHYRDANYERVMWILTFGTPLVIFTIDAVESTLYSKNNDKKEK